MRAKIRAKSDVIGVVLLASAVVLTYCAWGAYVLHAEQAAGIISQSVR